jgi:hypothetical protein
MSLDKSFLPDPIQFYESRGLVLKGSPRSKWMTTRCEFHGGSDSMRVNRESGAFSCMAGCGARGGDIISYLRASDNLDFVAAVKALGAWKSDGNPPKEQRPKALPASAGLDVLTNEATLLLILAHDMSRGQKLSSKDMTRLKIVVNRINHIWGYTNAR